jgi:hypothetical protein
MRNEEKSIPISVSERLRREREEEMTTSNVKY